MRKKKKQKKKKQKSLAARRDEHIIVVSVVLSILMFRIGDILLPLSDDYRLLQKYAGCCTAIDISIGLLINILVFITLSLFLIKIISWFTPHHMK